MKIAGMVIKEMLDNRGMRQKDLSDKAQISVATLSYIINGKSCTFQTANKIASALEVPLADICDRR